MVHKHELHELTMTRTLSKASGLLDFIDVCLSSMMANIHEYLTAVSNFFFYFRQSNLSKMLHVTFLLPVYKQFSVICKKQIT